MVFNEHYERFKCMRPWIGESFDDSKQKRLLIIGESHYLPTSSNLHLNADIWYQKTQEELNDDELKWIYTRGIIKKNKDKNFPKKGHGIYRNICNEINSGFYNYNLSSRIMDHIMFYNYFQRPADKSGDSIKVKSIDKEIASLVLHDNIARYKPELIIFTSALSGNCGSSIAKKKNIPYIITPHPTCAWWNRESKKYKGKGRNLIVPFLKKNRWLDMDAL